MSAIATMRPGTRRDLAIVQAYLAGLPLKDIGHPMTVYRALSRHGLKASRHGRRWEEIAVLYAEGKTRSAIAAETGCNWRTVTRALTRLGLR